MLRWFRSLCLLMIVSMSAVSCSGVQSQRTVLVPPIAWVDGTPTDLIRLGPGCRGKVYVTVDGQTELSQNEVVLPEGWYAVPPPPAKVTVAEPVK